MMGKNHLNLIKETWRELEKEPGVFQYNLNVLSRKCLPGKFKFYCELNPDRSKLRRIPQVISSLNSNFNENKFNFTKINPKEKLLDVPFEDSIITFIINQSPLTPYHSLICPDLENKQPQRITRKAMKFCIQFLLGTDDRSFRIGYNSPGAMASVNHLHLHLMYIDCDLYIDNAALQSIGKTGDTYRLHNEMPTEAICFIIDCNNKQSIVEQIFKFIDFLYEKSIPHNIFVTHERTQTSKRLKLFVYAREKHSFVKDLATVNAAFCEFSGFITVGDPDIYEKLTEKKVIEIIREQSKNVYNLIYKYLDEL